MSTDTTLEPAELEKLTEPYSDNLTSAQPEVYITTADLSSRDGLLVAPAFTLLHPTRISRLHYTELSTPLAESIRIPKPISNAELKEQLSRYLAQHVDLYDLNRFAKHEANLELVFRYLKLDESIRRYLRALEILLPDRFEASIFGAWLSSLLAASRHLPPIKIYSSFIAALLHDLGMLVIPRSIALKRGNFTPEEWLFMTAHPRASVEMIGGAKNFDAEVIAAIETHHELKDGTGYPEGLFLGNTQVVSALTALSDRIYGIWKHQLQSSGRSLFDIGKLLHVHTSHSVLQDDAEVWLTSLLKECTKKINVEQSIEEIDFSRINLDGLRQKIRIFGEIHDLIAKLRIPYLQVATNQVQQILLNLLEEVDDTVASVGLDVEFMDNWIKTEVANDPDKYTDELSEILVAVDEILWQYRRMYRLLGQLFATTHDLELQHTLTDVFQLLKETVIAPDSIIAKIDQSIDEQVHSSG